MGLYLCVFAASERDEDLEDVEIGELPSALV